ncbi:prominin-1-A isoform X1 [Pogona vitticeps]
MSLPPNLTQPVYQPQPSNSSGGLQGLINMMHSFLGLVQPNKFPTDTLTRLIKHQVDVKDTEFHKEVLIYEAGFLVCAAIGLLFIFLVPLVGLCFCCCRCCGRCGGFLYQKQTKHTDCKRQAFFASVLVVTAILLAGDICAYVSNHRITQGVDRSFSIFNSTIDNLQTYLESIPQEIDEILDSSSVPLNKTNSSLLNIGATLGKNIKVQIGGAAEKALNTTEQLIGEIVRAEQELKNVNESGHRLQELQKELSRNLTTLRDKINETLKKCGKPCQNVSVDNLTTGANFSMVPNVSDPLQLLTDLMALDPKATIAKARKTLSEIPMKVTNQTETVVSDAQSQLHNVKQQIDDIRGNLSLLDAMKNLSGFTNDLVKAASSFEPDVVTYDNYRWIVGVVLCCLVLLITVLNVLGLLCGALGLDPQELPTRRSCLSNCGGLFLMASVGFSFLFAWLLMLLVLLTFLIGGNAYTLVCRPWNNGHLLEFLSTPGLFPELNLTRLLQLKSSDVTLSSLYMDCENNAPLWSTLHLDDMVSLDEFLNISKYTSDIDATLNKINISVDSTALLSDKQKHLIQNLSKTDGPMHMDFASILEQLNKNMTGQDLSALANQLDALAGEPKDENRTELQQQADELRAIQRFINANFIPEIQNLNSSIRSLQNSMPRIPELAKSTLLQIEEAQTFMMKKTEEVVKNETSTFVHSILDLFTSYLDWAKAKIKEEVGRCKPAAWIVDTLNTVFCSYFVDSLNAFWFSLGWCTAFLLPSIILAVRLARFYRRMFADDLYEDDDTETMELSRQSMFKMPRAELRK